MGVGIGLLELFYGGNFKCNQKESLLPRDLRVCSSPQTHGIYLILTMHINFP